MRILSAKVLNAVEQKVKQVEVATGPLNWRYKERLGDNLISVIADDLTDVQDLALSDLNIWNEMLITNEVTLSPWSDENLVSLGLCIDVDELEEDDVDDVINTIKDKFSIPISSN